MSGSTIGGVIGGIVGLWTGIGWQAGWMIGSAIGGYVDPQQINSPSIGDAQQQTSQAGVPRPVVYGHPAPFAGNIIDSEAKARKIKVKQRQGKGGPVVVSERFLLTYAVRVCEGPVKVLRAWRNGEVVYDARAVEIIPPFEGGSLSDVVRYVANVRAKSAAFKGKMRIYEGTEEQLPDPALEALHGVGNTPYYRGTAYVVIENDDVTDMRGAAAQWRFEVAKSGTSEPVATVVPDSLSPPGGGSTADPSTNQHLPSIEGDVDISMIRGVFRIKVDTLYGNPVYVRVRDRDSGRLLYSSGWIGESAYAAELASVLGNLTRVNRAPYDGATYELSGAGEIAAFVGTLGHALSADGPIYSDTIAVEGMTHVIVESILPRTTLSGPTTALVTFDHPAPGLLPTHIDYVPQSGGMLLGDDGIIYKASWMPPLDLDAVTPDSITLASVVEDIAARCNVPEAKLHVATLIDEVPGFLIADQFTGADALRPTQQAFFYDLPEVDGAIRAVRRGGATTVAISDDDLVATDEKQERVRPQAVEYPLKVSVVTQDPAAEYAAVPQTSGRLSEDFPGSSEVVVQLPIPLSATQTAQIAHKLHKVMHSQAEGRVELTLPQAFSRYVASDTVAYRDRRWLIEEVRFKDGECTWKCTYDRVSAYSSNATGQAARPPGVPQSGLSGLTTFAALNLPRLRTADSVPGVYIAARGQLDGWVGAVIQLSVDGGVTFQEVATITSEATITSLALAASAGDSTLTVRSGGGDLESISDAVLASRGNAFALGSGDLPEIGQFQFAAEGDDYALTNVSRGQLGTVAADRPAGSRFVLLDAAVQFLPLDLTLSGRTLLFRAVSIGTAEGENPVIPFVYAPQFTTLSIEEYRSSSGEIYTDASGSIYYRTN